MPTRKQENLARVLADAPNMTKTAALLEAGYAKTTALKRAGAILAGVGVQEAQRIESVKRPDTARAIKRKAAAAILNRIDNDSASDQLLIGSYRVGHDIAAEEPEEAIVSLGAARARLRRALYRAWTAGKRAGLDGGGESHSAELTRE